jgi:hypothetical protein
LNADACLLLGASGWLEPAIVAVVLLLAAGWLTYRAVCFFQGRSVCACGARARKCPVAAISSALTQTRQKDRPSARGGTATPPRRTTGPAAPVS